MPFSKPLSQLIPLAEQFGLNLKDPAAVMPDAPAACAMLTQAGFKDIEVVQTLCKLVMPLLQALQAQGFLCRSGQSEEHIPEHQLRWRRMSTLPGTFKRAMHSGH